MNSTTICYCKNINEEAIVTAIRKGATTLKAIQQETTACTGNNCKDLNPKGICCSNEILTIIKRETGQDTMAKGCCCH